MSYLPSRLISQLMPMVMLYENFSVFIPLRPYQSCFVARHNLFYTLPSSWHTRELLQIDHVRLILFVIKKCTWFIILFSKNSIQQLSISSIIIQIEAIHIVYKTYMFDVEEGTIALRHSNDLCAAGIQSKLATYTQRITKTTLLWPGNNWARYSGWGWGWGWSWGWGWGWG